MSKFLENLKTAAVKTWTRLTSSKVAWMAVPAAVAQLWMALSGDDISKPLTAVFTALWIFLTLNNPDSTDSF